MNRPSAFSRRADTPRPPQAIQGAGAEAEQGPEEAGDYPALDRPRTPPLPAKPTMAPRQAEEPPADRARFREGGGSCGGVDDPASAVLVRLNDQLDLQGLVVLVPGRPDLARACRAACSRRTGPAACSARQPGPRQPSGPRRPARPGLQQVRRAASPPCADRSAVTAAMLAGRGLVGGQDPPGIRPAHKSHDGAIARQPAADALELVLGEQVLGVVRPPRMAPSTAQTARPCSPRRAGRRPPGQRRGQAARQGPPRVINQRLMLGIDLEDHLVQDRVPWLIRLSSCRRIFAARFAPAKQASSAYLGAAPPSCGGGAARLLGPLPSSGVRSRGADRGGPRAPRRER